MLQEEITQLKHELSKQERKLTAFLKIESLVNSLHKEFSIFTKGGNAVTPDAKIKATKRIKKFIFLKKDYCMDYEKYMNLKNRS